MKKVILSAFFLGITINVFGQIKLLTKEQYDVAHDNAYKKVGVLLRRVVTETINYNGNNVDSIETLTKETLPNGDERWNSITKKETQIVDKLQLIYLGKYEYRKKGEMDWTKRCVK